jgi:hypothetical protein
MERAKVEESIAALPVSEYVPVQPAGLSSHKVNPPQSAEFLFVKSFELSSNSVKATRDDEPHGFDAK